MPESNLTKKTKTPFNKEKIVYNIIFFCIAFTFSLTVMNIISKSGLLWENTFIHIAFFISIFLTSFLLLVGYANKEIHRFFWFLTGVIHAYGMSLVFIFLLKEKVFSYKAFSFYFNLPLICVIALVVFPLIPILRGLNVKITLKTIFPISLAPFLIFETILYIFYAGTLNVSDILGYFLGFTLGYIAVEVRKKFKNFDSYSPNEIIDIDDTLKTTNKHPGKENFKFSFVLILIVLGIISFFICLIFLIILLYKVFT